jgi:hypothetical protein
MDEARRRWEQAQQEVRAAQARLDSLARAVIKAGVSTAARVKLLAAAKVYEVAQQLKHQKQLEARFKALVDDLKTEKDEFQKQLRKQADYTKFEKELAPLQKLDKKAAFKEAEANYKALVALHAKYDKMLRQAFKAAGLSEKKLITAVRKYAGKGANVTSSGSGSYVVSPLGEEPTAPASDSFCLRPPFIGSETSSWSVLGFNSATANKNTGNMRLKTFIIPSPISLGYNSGYVENFFTVPPGFSQLKVTAKFQAKYLLDARGLGGFAFAEGRLGFSLVGTTGSPQSATRSLPTSLCIFIGGQKVQGDKAIRVSTTFSIPNQGGEFLLRADAYDAAGGYWIIAAYSDVNTTANEMCVELLP